MGESGDIAQLRIRVRTEAAVLVRNVAEPSSSEETIKDRIARAALRLGWSRRRTEDIWRREAHRVEVWEMDQLRSWKFPES